MLIISIITALEYCKERSSRQTGGLTSAKYTASARWRGKFLALDNLNLWFHAPEHRTASMEEDRAQVDLGVAVDVEEQIEEAAAAQRLPKKRFVGRRQAAEAALKNESNGSVEESGAIQSTFLQILHRIILTGDSFNVGRRQATEAALKNESNGSVEESGAIQSTFLQILHRIILTGDSFKAQTSSSNPQSGPSRDIERPRHQRGHRAPAPELLLRNPQNHTPNSNEWVEEDCSADA